MVPEVCTKWKKQIFTAITITVRIFPSCYTPCTIMNRYHLRGSLIRNFRSRLNAVCTFFAFAKLNCITGVCLFKFADVAVSVGKRTCVFFVDQKISGHWTGKYTKNSSSFTNYTVVRDHRIIRVLNNSSLKSKVGKVFTNVTHFSGRGRLLLFTYGHKFSSSLNRHKCEKAP